jgi:hypothetical protein
MQRCHRSYPCTSAKGLQYWRKRFAIFLQPSQVRNTLKTLDKNELNAGLMFDLG